MSQLLRTKSIDRLVEQSEEPGRRLRRTLGPWSLTALGVGAVIGTGIFILTGTAAAGESIAARGNLAVGQLRADRFCRPIARRQQEGQERSVAASVIEEALTAKGACELEPGVRHEVAGFENHAGRTLLDPGAEALGRVVFGFGNDGSSGFEGCRVERAVGTYLHGPLLPRNPWLADWLLAQALAHAGGGAPPELPPLPDELERQAFEVASARARARGGR